MFINREDIVTVSELVKNFSSCREKTKKNAKTIIFKNNKPDMALIDIDEYERISTIAEIVEDYVIMNTIDERKKNDTGERYSHEFVLGLLKDKLEKKQSMEAAAATV